MTRVVSGPGAQEGSNDGTGVDHPADAASRGDMPADDAPVEVPVRELSPTALRGVVEAYVLREGTDYGERPVAFEDKVDQVLASLARGKARIVFDPATGSVTIVPVD